MTKHITAKVKTELLEEYELKKRELVNVGNKQPNLTKDTTFFFRSHDEDDEYYYCYAVAFLGGHDIKNGRIFRKEDLEILECEEK